jgi:hypothetical protein
MNGPYPIYEPDDENAQNFPMPGDNPVPPLESIPDALDFCPVCDGDGGWYCQDDIDDSDDWVECDRCEGTGRP